ncbi:MAG: hypothetical protein FD170_1316 [Bacteroidetes bacterium]|nr:MAG: hypothetical protein FD170_1316 [Bacteroidota bacterium]
MKPTLNNILAIVMLLAVSSCSYLKKQAGDDILAIAGDKYLYRKELEGVIPKGIPATDSMEIARQFIDNWIRQEVLLKHAESNLEESRKDFAKQLEAYRNSLIIYEYESELIRQKLDTVVSETEIQEFYQANESNFQLPENIIKVSYVKIPTESKTKPSAKKARQLLVSKNPDDLIKLMELCDQSMFSCRIDDENWITFSDFIRELSLDINNQEDFLKNKTFFETNDSLFTYLIRINEYKTIESSAPASLVQDKIRNLILNKRKSELINRMQQQIFEEALKNKEFEIL